MQKVQVNPVWLHGKIKAVTLDFLYCGKVQVSIVLPAEDLNQDRLDRVPRDLMTPPNSPFHTFIFISSEAQMLVLQGENLVYTSTEQTDFGPITAEVKLPLVLFKDSLIAALPEISNFLKYK
jgi:hypothetical protein